MFVIESAAEACKFSHATIYAANLQLLAQVLYLLYSVKNLLNDPKKFHAFLKITVISAVSLGAISLGVGTASGYSSPWTGSILFSLDPTYAKDNIPLLHLSPSISQQRGRYSCLIFIFCCFFSQLVFFFIHCP